MGRRCPNFYCWSRAETECGLVWVHRREGVFHFPLPSAQRIEERKEEKERESRRKEKPQPKAVLGSFGSGCPLLPTSSPLISFTSLN